jgi:hypothetical protein
MKKMQKRLDKSEKVCYNVVIIDKKVRTIETTESLRS